MASRLVTVSVDFSAQAWTFWESVERNPCLSELHERVRALVRGDDDCVRVPADAWETSRQALSRVRGWNTGMPDAPHPLRWTP